MNMRSRRPSSSQAQNNQGRRIVLWVLFMCGFVLVLGRLFQLQIINAQEMVDRAKRQHQKMVALEPSRGTIMDKQGRVLAINTEVPSIFANPKMMEFSATTTQSIAKILNQPFQEVEDKLKQSRDFVWLKRKASREEEAQVQPWVSQGVGIVMEERRYYPKGSLLAHVLGFAGIDNQGLEGLENRYDAELRGEVKHLLFHQDALGRVIAHTHLGAGQSVSGNTLTLTIDEVIQYIAENALSTAVQKSSAKGGVLIVMDPPTGEILAWALAPTFDPNNPYPTETKYWRNRAVTDPYEPGSTLKVPLVAAALEEGVVEPGTMIYAGDGEMPVSGTVIHDHKKAGWLTFAKAVEQSSNVAAVKVAMEMGRDRVYQYLRAFGFGERTEVDLPGESKGLLKEPQDWGNRTLASVAIGQEIGVTPLQMLTALSAIANNGWLMRPYVVKDIQDGQGRLVHRNTPEVRRRPVSAHTAETTTALLVNVVKNGTGKRAFMSDFKVAGKTGTAQKVDPHTGKYSKTQLIGSFMGFVPAENPRLAMIVVIDEPQDPAWGGVVAAPVFRQVAEQVLRYLEVTPGQETETITVAAVR